MRSRCEFSKSTKAMAWERCQGRCQCGCMQLIRGTPEYDHIIEDTLDGGNDLSNCAVLDPKCHARKTQARRPEIDKARRGQEKRLGLRESRYIPLVGTKRSGFKRAMDGTVTRRDRS